MNGIQDRAKATLLKPKSLLITLAVVVVLAVAAVVVTATVAGGFGSGPNRFVFSSGFDHSGHIKRSYRTFVGLVRNEVTVEQGQTIDIAFAATVDKGSLSVELKDPQGNEVWRVNVADDQQTNRTKNLVAEQTGSYVLVVTGLDTGGSFDLSWEVEPN